MKRTIALIIILLSIAKVGSSQAALIVLIFGDKVASENFFFSMKGGITASSTPGLSPSDFKPGAHFGLVANIRMSEKLYFAPEFLALSQKGSRNLEIQTTGHDYLDSISLSSAMLSRKLNYLDFPLFFRYEFTKKLTLSGGPQFSILSSASNFYENKNTDKYSLKYDVDLKSDHKWFDVGIGIDIGYMVSKQKNGKAMEIHARYTFGLLDVSSIPEESYRQSVFHISAVFPFQLADAPE